MKIQLQSMDTAPRDRPILVWHDHNSDPYHDPFWEERGRLTIYGGHCEGLSMRGEVGFVEAEWGGGWSDSWEDGGGSMPDWWFMVGSEFEVPLAPVGWIDIYEIVETPAPIVRSNHDDG